MLLLTLVLRLQYNGEKLADTVESALKDQIRGTVTIESIDWPLADLSTLLTGGWLRVEVKGLKVKDENDILVIDIPRVTLKLDVHAAIGGNFLIRNLRIEDGGLVVIRSIPEPYPAHEYDKTVVSLLSAFYPKRTPSFFTGYSAAAKPTVDVHDFDVSGPGITLQYSDTSFVASVNELRGGGFFYLNYNDPLAPKLYYSLAAVDSAKTTAKTATITSPSLDVELYDIKLNQLAQLPSRWPSELVPRDIRYNLTARGEDGMEIEIDGALLDSWVDIYGGDVRVALTVTNAGGLAKRASGGIASGDDLSLQLNLSGPFLAPRGQAELLGLQLQVPIGEERPPLVLRIEKAVPVWDIATDSGSMKEVIATTEDGGEIQLSADFQLKPLWFDIGINIPKEKSLELGPYLPPNVAKLHLTNSTKLYGSLSATGSQEKQELEQLNLHFGDARISGQASRNGDKIEAKGINIGLRDTRITNMHGFADPETQAIKLGFNVDSKDTGYWLRKFKLKPFARSVQGRFDIRGTLDSPEASAKLVATGVPVVNRVSVNLDYKNKTLRVREAQASAFGGWLRGSGQILLEKIPRFSKLEAQMVNLKLSQIPAIGKFLTGELDVEIRGSGTTKRPAGSIVGSLSDWTVANENYANTKINFEAKGDGSKHIDTTIGRELGGTLVVDATVDNNSSLQGSVRLQKVPIDGILKAADIGPDMGGDFSTRIDLGGTLQSPTGNGEVTLLRSWFQQAFLGTAGFTVETIGPGKVRLRGQFFQGRVRMDCSFNTQAPYALKMDLDLHRIELDRFASELSEKVGMRGWISGHISYEGSLLGNAPPTIDASLSEMEVIIDKEDEEGRPSPIRFRNKTPILLRYDGNTLSFLKTTTITGPTGDFTLRGKGTKDSLQFELDGGVAIKLLQPYLEQKFENMSGNLIASISIEGSIEDYRVVGVLEVENVVLKPTGQDAIIRVPTGKIDFSNDQLSITGLRVVVNDQFSSDVSEVTIGGGLRLENFVPAAWAVVIEGQLAGKLLLLAAPAVFSAASGSAGISINLIGAGKQPSVDGTIEFDDSSPLTLTPRSARREFSFTGGTVYLTDKIIELEDLEAMVDGEGLITKLSGDISLKEWKPVDVDLYVWARDLPFRVPRTMELTAHLNKFRVVGGVDALEISGDIEIADGRYIRRFDPLLDSFKPTPATASDPSIFEEIPILGNAQLDINVYSPAFFVDNNLAQIEFNGNVNIKGTPTRPVLDGSIEVVQGTLKLLGSHARFDRTSGSVRFSPGLLFPNQTPYLDLSSEANYKSSDGQEHLVQLTFQGTLSNVNWALSTSGGLNTMQTFQLIFVGKTPEEVRRSFGDEAVSRRPGELNNQTIRSDNRLQAFDKVAKDFASQWFSLIIGDRLRAATKLDVARLQLGTASVGFYGEKKLTRSLLFIGEIERSLSGWQWNVSGRYRFNDTSSFDFGYFERYFDDEAEEDVSQGSASVTLRRYLIP